MAFGKHQRRRTHGICLRIPAKTSSSTGARQTAQADGTRVQQVYQHKCLETFLLTNSPKAVDCDGRDWPHPTESLARAVKRGQL